ncbi:GNAT family N-acetyltransferase [Kribbella swartbergensis]
MELLPNREVHRVRRLFEAEHLALVIDAVIAGNSPARVWADDSGAGSALVWDRHHSVYFAGSVEDAQEWRALFDREIAPLGDGVLKIYATPDAAGTVFAGLPLQRRERVLYRGHGPVAHDWSRRLPPGFHLSAIDDLGSGLGGLANATDVIAEIESTWASIADFLRTGFGFVAHDTEQIVSWCVAEFVSDGKCGIGIETIGSHRGRGFATLTASAFTEHCAERNITPYWDAWTSNRPSTAVAEKLGLRKIETYHVSLGDFKDVHPPRR